MRDFFPTSGGGLRAGARPNEQDEATGLVNQMANRKLRTMRQLGARAFSPGAGRESSPDDLRASAAYQLLQKKLRGIPATGPGGVTSPERLAALADLKEFEEKQALGQASRDIERDWRSEVGTTPITNAYTGARADGDVQHLTKRAAAAMANNTALGRPSPMASEPRLEDPRLTVQYRNEMGRRTSANPMDALRARMR